MDIDDKELFDSAMTDEPIPEVATEAPADVSSTEAPQQDDRPRDEHGRFAAKQAAEPQPEQAAEQPQAKDEANVPSWRLREVREEAERRVAETEARWQRQFEMLQRQNAPKPEPQPAPDLFDNPTGAIKHGVQQEMTPYEQRLQAMEAREQSRLEYYSRREAFRDHGEQAVRTAYEWLANGVRSQDPDVMHTYNRAMQSEHPYDAVVQAYKRADIMHRIGALGDLDKWAIQRAQELQQQQSQPQGNGQSRQPSRSPQGSIVKLPPSLSRVPASQVEEDDESDTSDAALFRHAMR
jgi:hypothetical protein